MYEIARIIGSIIALSTLVPFWLWLYTLAVGEAIYTVIEHHNPKKEQHGPTNPARTTPSIN